MKRTIAWIILIILIILILGLSYIKFFVGETTLIEERPADNNMSEVIKTALTDIVNNFNKNEKIEQYKKDGINISATFNENSNSIFISYETDTTTTYEFTYDNLNLVISILNEEENITNFKKVEEILIYAIQERLNVEEDITDIVNEYIEGNKELEIITKEEKEDVITHKINIAKKIESNKEEENVTTNETETMNTEENNTEETSNEENNEE